MGGRLEAKEHEVNRTEHAELREMIAQLGVEFEQRTTKLGVEFEQHRNDTKALADGILELVRKTTALEGADAARVTRLEVRGASLVPKGRGRNKTGPA